MAVEHSFLTEVRQVAVPITAQSVLMSALAMTDQLMVGQLGETGIAASGVGSKITSIVMVLLAGVGTGVSFYCAQYWGKGDRVRIRQLLGLGLVLGSAFIGTMALLVGLFPSAAVSP
ncbi:MAG: MATE family efflux transporter, partial [Dermatophilaceae bacterium]